MAATRSPRRTPRRRRPAARRGHVPASASQEIVAERPPLGGGQERRPVGRRASEDRLGVVERRALEPARAGHRRVGQDARRRRPERDREPLGDERPERLRARPRTTARRPSSSASGRPATTEARSRKACIVDARRCSSLGVHRSSPSSRRSVTAVATTRRADRPGPRPRPPARRRSRAAAGAPGGTGGSDAGIGGQRRERRGQPGLDLREAGPALERPAGVQADALEQALGEDRCRCSPPRSGRSRRRR